MYRLFSKILVAIFIFVSIVAADEVAQQKELDELRRQISEYEQKISQKKEKEQTAANFINSLDKEIDLTTKYLKTLRTDIHQNERQINIYQNNIDQISEEISKLKELIKKRLVSYYKKRRLKDIELLLSSETASQVRAWMKYQQIVAEHDKRTYQSLIDKQEILKQQQDLLKLKIRSNERNIITKQREEKQLQTSREKRAAMLSDLKKDTDYLEQHLEEIKEAQRQILILVSQSEEERLTRTARTTKPREQAVPSTRTQKFASLKGKLIWPTQGEIITHFGSHKHPTLKTVTENLGIDIKAPLGSPIVAVDQGRVQTITWQRGLGNIIMLSHDEGFYTMYTHMAEIHVELRDNVEEGQVIGTVGDSGSLNGSVLHFQIWKNTENLDPEKWLGSPLLTYGVQ